MLCLILSLALAQPQSINAEPRPSQGNVSKELEALGTTIKQLAARIDKLEGLITAADLVGTYVIQSLELDGGPSGPLGLILRSKTSNGTLRLNSDGTFDLLFTIGGFGMGWRTFGDDPVQHVFLDFGLENRSAPGHGTWTFSEGNRLLLAFPEGKGVAFSITGGGRVFVNRQNSPSDHTELIIVVRCDVSPDACAGVWPP